VDLYFSHFNPNPVSFPNRVLRADALNAFGIVLSVTRDGIALLVIQAAP